MADLYREPVLYGIDDVTVTRDGETFEMRIYYPSDEGSVFGVPVRPGTYPLVVFAHGQRNEGGVDSENIFGPQPGCPKDPSLDYQRWSAVLHLLARCGFVVAAPDLNDVILSSEASAVRLETAITWLRFEWENRGVLWGREQFLDPDNRTFREAAAARPGDKSGLGRFGVNHLGEGVGVRPPRPGTVAFGTATNLGVAGHSLGAAACARLAVRGHAAVRAIASISGTFNEDEAIAALIDARAPTLMMAGTLDIPNMSTVRASWGHLVRPKHQAAFQGAGHWDWFGTDGGIQYCDPDNRPRCGPYVWSAASEMLVGFMTKYLYNRWQIPPHLLGERYTEQPWGFFRLPGVSRRTCGPKTRWDDPMAPDPFKVGEESWGFWLEADPW